MRSDHQESSQTAARRPVKRMRRVTLTDVELTYPSSMTGIGTERSTSAVQRFRLLSEAFRRCPNWPDHPEGCYRGAANWLQRLKLL